METINNNSYKRDNSLNREDLILSNCCFNLKWIQKNYSNSDRKQSKIKLKLKKVKTIELSENSAKNTIEIQNEGFWLILNVF